MNGIKYLLDTNIIIGLLQKNLAILNWLKDKEVKVSECAYSSITRMELLSFSNLSNEEIKAIERLLSGMTYLPITTYIENETIAFRRKHKVKLPDAIIVATSLNHQIELLTHDKKIDK